MLYNSCKALSIALCYSNKLGGFFIPGLWLLQDVTKVFSYCYRLLATSTHQHVLLSFPVLLFVQTTLVPRRETRDLIITTALAALASASASPARVCVNAFVSLFAYTHSSTSIRITWLRMESVFPFHPPPSSSANVVTGAPRPQPHTRVCMSSEVVTGECTTEARREEEDSGDADCIVVELCVCVPTHIRALRV